jgi:D-lactate dehydrogenase
VDDKQRKMELIERLKLLQGLDEATYRRMLSEVEQTGEHSGLDEEGRVRVTLFDAKPRDMDSFDAANSAPCALHYVRASLSVDTAYAAQGSKVVCIFVNDTCDAPVVERLAAFGVELIALRCAGFNNVDLDACRQHSIDVVRVPAYSPYAVAEFTVALMMMLNRRLHHAYIRNRSGNFVLEGLTGFDMHGKTVGVIGTGKIGQCTIDILLGFGCRVLAYDKFPHPALVEREGVQYTDLEQLLPQSDIVTLHVPLFLETYHLINRAAIECMKDGCDADQYQSWRAGGHEGPDRCAEGWQDRFRGARRLRRRGGDFLS